MAKMAANHDGIGLSGVFVNQPELVATLNAAGTDVIPEHRNRGYVLRIAPFKDRVTKEFIDSPVFYRVLCRRWYNNRPTSKRENRDGDPAPLLSTTAWWFPGTDGSSPTLVMNHAKLLIEARSRGVWAEIALRDGLVNNEGPLSVREMYHIGTDVNVGADSEACMRSWTTRLAATNNIYGVTEAEKNIITATLPPLGPQSPNDWMVVDLPARPSELSFKSVMDLLNDPNTPWDNAELSLLNDYVRMMAKGFSMLKQETKPGRRTYSKLADAMQLADPHIMQHYHGGMSTKQRERMHTIYRMTSPSRRSKLLGLQALWVQKSPSVVPSGGSAYPSTYGMWFALVEAGTALQNAYMTVYHADNYSERHYVGFATSDVNLIQIAKAAAASGPLFTTIDNRILSNPALLREVQSSGLAPNMNAVPSPRPVRPSLAAPADPSIFSISDVVDLLPAIPGISEDDVDELHTTIRPEERAASPGAGNFLGDPLGTYDEYDYQSDNGISILRNGSRSPKGFDLFYNPRSRETSLDPPLQPAPDAEARTGAGSPLSFNGRIVDSNDVRALFESDVAHDDFHNSGVESIIGPRSTQNERGDDRFVEDLLAPASPGGNRIPLSGLV